MTQYTFRYLIAAPAGNVSDQLNALCAEYDKFGGAETFTAGYGPQGATTPTWFVCDTLLTSSQRSFLAGHLTQLQANGVKWKDISDGSDPQAVLAGFGLFPIQTS